VTDRLTSFGGGVGGMDIQVGGGGKRLQELSEGVVGAVLKLSTLRERDDPVWSSPE